MASSAQKIVPNLWFDRQAEEAARFYVSLLERSRVGEPLRATKAGFENHGLPEGSILTIDFELAGQRFIGINGGPLFKFNPSVSFQVACRTAEEVDRLWAPLSEGGRVYMEIGEYPFSPRFGWAADRFGLSWQVMAVGDREIRQKITPSMLFVGPQCGRAEEALRLYTSVFPGSRIGPVDRYGPGEEPDRAGTVRRAVFVLEGQEFAAQDSAADHPFAFSEAVSLMVLCETQAEIDRYWSLLTADGGQESMCGWLKDKFGASWQVAPVQLERMLRDPDRAKVERVTEAFLKMRKFDIAALEKAYRG